ncbi:MAG TPA: hypothetical protein VMT39_03150 [Candidatus Bathyarchaeia archaeon]|nr:hypothetical protein [Candidatus Bathyarchaeia archaeon]
MNQRLTMKSALTLVASAAMLAVSLGLPAAAQETIDATAMGTSTQMGKNVSIKLIITSWSSKEDQKTLSDAFKAGQNQGLVKALEKMKPVGRIQIPGTLGYDVAYAASIPTTTGRTVRFVTNRKISFGEAARNTPSQAYNLTGGQINIDDQDKNKSAGVLYPAAQLVINKDGDLQIELRKNPWRLTNIIVRGKVEKE